MYGWSAYKQTWKHKLNLHLRMSETLSFVFLCVGVPTLILTVVRIELILGFLKEYTTWSQSIVTIIWKKWEYKLYLYLRISGKISRKIAHHRQYLW
jgi:hypothetical protein